MLDRRVEVEAQRGDGSRFPVELTITRIEVPGEPVSPAICATSPSAAGRARAARLARAHRGGRLRRAPAHRARPPRRRAAAAGERRDEPAAGADQVERGPGAAAASCSTRRSRSSGGDRRAARARPRHPPRGAHRGWPRAGAARPRRGAAPRRRGSSRCRPSRCPAPVEAAAYFVVAEAMTNVARHAPARR